MDNNVISIMSYCDDNVDRSWMNSGAEKSMLLPMNTFSRLERNDLRLRRVRYHEFFSIMEERMIVQDQAAIIFDALISKEKRAQKSKH